MHDLAVVIGRFAPFHNGHAETIKEAERIARRIIIVVGSAHQDRTHKTPWLYEERSKMIRMLYPNSKKLLIHGQRDIPGKDEVWSHEIAIRVRLHALDQHKVVMLTNQKESPEWLAKLPKLFPRYDHKLTTGLPGVCATDVRNFYFNMDKKAAYKNLPKQIERYLEDFYDSAYFWEAFDAYVQGAA